VGARGRSETSSCVCLRLLCVCVLGGGGPSWSVRALVTTHACKCVRHNPVQSVLFTVDGISTRVLKTCVNTLRALMVDRPHCLCTEWLAQAPTTPLIDSHNKRIPRGRVVQVWVAPSVPSRMSSDPATDGRSNSLARLQRLDGQNDAPTSRWWYNILATDVAGVNGSAACAALANDGSDRVSTRACSSGADADSRSVTLAPDGTLRVTRGSGTREFKCVVQVSGEGSEVVVRLGLSPASVHNTSHCTTFNATVEGSLVVTSSGKHSIALCLFVHFLCLFVPCVYLFSLCPVALIFFQHTLLAFVCSHSTHFFVRAYMCS
jgi:hypothetical protein